MTDELRAPIPPLSRICSACGSELAPSLLACPSCQRLVHADRLRGLAETAETAERAGDPRAALGSWREALVLLPAESRQYASVADRIARLNRLVESAPASASAAPPIGPPAGTGSSRWSGGVVSGVLGTLALALWKFKFLAVLLLTKAKFLLLGLTKASTFLSMFVSLGVYATAFGVPFALGLVLSIYVHEMGHVAAMIRYGVPASAPLFLPGLGAIIRLNQAFTDPKQDARVGLAGPIWGTGAAVFCVGVFLLSQKPIWAALAHFGAFINLFNLLPVWQLDGGRAFRALSRPQRWLALAGVAAVWAVSEEGLLVLLLLGGSARAVLDKTNPKPDASVLFQYLSLVGLLAALMRLGVFLPNWPIGAHGP
jgi:Zn-dependent protease